jgi:hypothetical protein
MKIDFTSQIRQKTDSELKDIFIHAKDYSPEFIQATELELQVRNINIPVSKQIKPKPVNRKQLEHGKPGSPLYIFLSFVLALFGGILGIYAGYIYSQSKITTEDGEQFYVYSEETRKLGKIMMLVGVGVILLFLLKGLFA